jgi:hypothetical protein
LLRGVRACAAPWLDLADALAGDGEVLADLLEGVVAGLADAEAHAQDLLLARGERGEDSPGLVGEVHVDDRVRGRDHVLVLDEVAEMRVLFLADRCLERDGLLGDLEDLADLVERELHLLGDLLGVGSRPSSWTRLRLVRISLLMVSIMCTGMRIVRA